MFITSVANPYKDLSQKILYTYFAKYITHWSTHNMK